MQDLHLTTTIGVVKDTNDPQQMGRVRVYCPAIDADDYIIEELPWCGYASPFAGSVKNKKVGPSSDSISGPSSYGFWSVPKVGAQVIIQFLNGDSNYRIWTHCLYAPQTNRGLPAGRNFNESGAPGPWSDSYGFKPSQKKLASSGLSSGDFYKTRGGYERQIAQAMTIKDGSEGYSENPDKLGTLDPQTYSWTSPGGHFISMQDASDFCRMRFKTTDGSQLIMDDTNGFIYLSSSEGKNYMEFDTKTGKMYFYAQNDIAFRTEGNFEITSDKEIRMHGKQGVHIQSPKEVNVESTGDSVHIKASKNIYTQALSDIYLGAGGNVVQSSGNKIYLNTMGATPASPSTAPVVVPEHEPWVRK